MPCFAGATRRYASNAHRRSRSRFCSSHDVGARRTSPGRGSQSAPSLSILRSNVQGEFRKPRSAALLFPLSLGLQHVRLTAIRPCQVQEVFRDFRVGGCFRHSLGLVSVLSQRFGFLCHSAPRIVMNPQALIWFNIHDRTRKIGEPLPVTGPSRSKPAHHPARIVRSAFGGPLSIGQPSEGFGNLAQARGDDLGQTRRPAPSARSSDRPEPAW